MNQESQPPQVNLALSSHPGILELWSVNLELISSLLKYNCVPFCVVPSNEPAAGVSSCDWTPLKSRSYDPTLGTGVVVLSLLVGELQSPSWISRAVIHFCQPECVVLFYELELWNPPVSWRCDPILEDGRVSLNPISQSCSIPM